MSKPQPFHQAWTLGDTTDYIDMPDFPSNGGAQAQDDWRKKILEPIEDRLASALGQHVAWLMEQGVEVIPPCTESIHTSFISDMRELAKDPCNERAQLACGRHIVLAVNNSYFFYHSDRNSEAVEKTHEALVALIDEGNFRRVHSDLQLCHSTGLRLEYRYENWKGTAGQIELVHNEKLGRDTTSFLPLTHDDIPRLGTLEASIPVPSGRLWISDWFRIKTFDDLTKPLDDEGEYSEINSAHGRAQITKRYADRIGVVHVSCGSPDILATPGAIMAGYLMRDDDGDKIEPKSGRLIGKISANLRWTSMVDPQHLVGLLAGTLGEEEARRQVEEYEKTADDLIVLEVPAGTHHLYFSGRQDVFQKTVENEFNCSELPLGDFEVPAMALTQAPLSPKARRRPSGP